MMGKDVTVAISSGFLDAFARLPRKMQTKTSAFVNKFKNDPRSPGIHYEKINSADSKLRSVRIDDAYRGIVMRDDGEGVYLLLWVDHHDEAYDWARRRKVAVNPATGTLQVYEAVETEAPSEGEYISGLFDDAEDVELIEMGVPNDLLDYVRGIVDVADFGASEAILPADAFENLSWIVNGIPVCEVLELVRADAASGECGDGVADALALPESLRSFVVVEGEEELYRILSAPLEKWRVFLHPSQRKLVERAYRGPARVLGGAGTGKTVVAMHRAKHLAQRGAERLDGAAGTQRILFTTFSSTLAADISLNMRKICTKDELSRIDVVNLDAWVSRYLRQNEMDFRIEYEDEALNSIWEEAISDSGVSLDFDPAFYADEWTQVILSQDIDDVAGYAHARRVGRGIRLTRRQRLDVWSVVEKYRQIMKARRLRDVDFAMSECEKLVLHTGGAGLYAHVVVDEGQDFSVSAYRLIRVLAGPEHEDDIFIAGDSHQRIYGRRAVLSRCGINIRGRSSILRINYRTTEEIRRRATALLDGCGFDDLDGGLDDDTRIQSLLHGADPAVEEAASVDEELAHLIGSVSSLIGEGVDSRDICIVARTKKMLSTLEHGLQKAGLPACLLASRKADDRRVEGVRLASMHRVKGLEFDHVFIVDASEGSLPPIGAVRRAKQEGAVEELMQSEKCLLYVAMTRARKSVTISYSGAKSRLL